MNRRPSLDGSSQQRILIGTHEIVRQVHDLGDGFRRLGHDVTTVVAQLHRFYPDLRYDHVIDDSPGAMVTTPALSRLGRLKRRVRLNATRKPIPAWIRGHDVFVFLYGSSFLPGNVDLPLLRRLGKTVVSIFLGSDVRHWSAAQQFRSEIGLGTYEGYRQGRSLDRATTTLRMAELYADAEFMQPSYAELAIGPYQHMHLALDLSLYRYEVPRREVPVVVHAPSRRAVKGTEEILAAADALRAEGVDFELRLLENVPNAEVLAHLSDADVVVVELNESHYGMLGLEAMASGCAVLGGHRADVVPLPKGNPVVHVTPATVVEELRSVLADLDRRTQLAEDGHAFVTSHHDHVEVARRVLAGPGRARRGDFDYVPTWFVERYVPPARSGLNGRNRALTAKIARRCGVDDAALASLRTRGLA